MVTIEKHGNMYHTYRFECNGCGCIFKVDTCFPNMRCPECGTWCAPIKEEFNIPSEPSHFSNGPFSNGPSEKVLEHLTQDSNNASTAENESTNDAGNSQGKDW